MYFQQVLEQIVNAILYIYVVLTEKKFVEALFTLGYAASVRGSLIFLFFDGKNSSVWQCYYCHEKPDTISQCDPS